MSVHYKGAIIINKSGTFNFAVVGLFVSPAIFIFYIICNVFLVLNYHGSY